MQAISFNPSSKHKSCSKITDPAKSSHISLGFFCQITPERSRAAGILALEIWESSLQRRKGCVEQLAQAREYQEQEADALSAAEIGAVAHLYRGEVYRSTLWRTRLDTTTNWAVVTLGVALSITFASPEASPLPLVLVGILILFFLAMEARRYRYFNVFRARTRWLETHFYAPMLSGEPRPPECDWRRELSKDYRRPEYHVGYGRAIARRIRRNYLWILLIQSIAFAGKVIIHPGPAESLSQVLQRAAVGPLPGGLIVGLGMIYVASFLTLAVWSQYADRQRAIRRGGKASASMG
ncbi:hypothetical protein RSK20926_18532 [Roseobacter sp. SK209-2-6]|nr:hypothetical protein RSK20926_18532 [Roseobacter sp. SK209-2-6]